VTEKSRTGSGQNVLDLLFVVCEQVKGPFIRAYCGSKIVGPIVRPPYKVRILVLEVKKRYCDQRRVSRSQVFFTTMNGLTSKK
jgi:hypothetical protein